MKRYNPEIKRAAYTLYLKRYTPKEIAKALNLPNARIVYYWAEKHGWASMLKEEAVEDAIERRLALLVERDNKNQLELEEISRLIDHQCKLIRAKQKFAAVSQVDNVVNDQDVKSHSQDNRPTPKNKNEKPRKNDVSHLTKEDFDRVANEILYKHQQYVRGNLGKHRRRFILKSRQIGFTFYFAFEAFEDAVLTGNNQIFVSSSKPQARVFAMYIKSIAEQFFGVRLKGGDLITLSNHANLILCANNVSTAQSYAGNVYFDEVFWMSKFSDLYTAASGMATQKKYRETLFSTPSTKMHPAYKKWVGEEWKEGNPKRKNVEFPDDETLRMNGTVCPDKWWRLLITLQDAIDLGFDLVDIDDIRESKSVEAFNILYCCKFANSGKSVFDFEKLQKCVTDSALWQDFDPTADRPFGNREVWAGFDPSRTRDNASFAIVAPPIHELEKFRVLEIYQWKGLNFKHMANKIKEIKGKYRMTYIGVDITGIGYGVYEHLQTFAMRETVPIHYDVRTKNQLVLKMIDVVESGRIEWGEELNALNASFLSIEQVATPKSNLITYAASRSESTGHADEFFAISHAVYREPLNTTKKQSKWII